MILSMPREDDSFDFSADAPSIKRGSVLSLGTPLYLKNNTDRNSLVRQSVLTPPRSPEQGSPIEMDISPGKTAPGLDSQTLSPSESEDDISIDFPFVRAIHSFNPSTLATSGDSMGESEDPSLICCSFEESDIALIHSIHSSGWGDATLLKSGRRGWIPTNYFVPYADPKAVPLLSVVLNFVLNPRNHEIHNHSNNGIKAFTFSQASITNIVSGVRSLLEACGTLTRDTPIVKRSQSIRKFRKTLLTEVAILVSVAKQNRNSTDDSIIEKLVNVCFRIVTKAVMFLDIWAIDTNINDEMDDAPSPVKSCYDGNLNMIRPSDTVFGPKSAMEETSTFEENNNGNVEPRPRARPISAAALRRSSMAHQRESVIFHRAPPTASQRLDEVNEALTSYLGVFIHRMTLLDTDAAASTQILVNTRKSMLACRELLATVESISSRFLPRNRDLERSKDKLFAQIRGLVTAAREVVHESSRPMTTTHEIGRELVSDEETEKATKVISNSDNVKSREQLVEKATECARTSGECVVRCRYIINRIGDFQLPATREYPDFSDGVIAVPFYRRDSDVVDDENRKSLLPHIPSLSPIIPTEVSPTEPKFNKSENFDINGVVKPLAVVKTVQSSLEKQPEQQPHQQPHQQQTDVSDQISSLPLEDQVIYGDNGKIRGATVEGLIFILTEETKQIDQFLLSTFFLTFRMFTTPERVAKALVARYSPEVDDEELNMSQLEDISGRRVKVFNFVKRWMESHWQHSKDAPVLDVLLDLAENHFPKIIPNGNLVIRDLASKLASNALNDGEPIVPREISLPGGYGTRLAMIPSASSSTTSLSKHQVSILQKANEVGGFYGDDAMEASATEDEGRSIASSTWTPSLKKRYYHSIHGVSILDFDPMDIASQLTLIDNEIYCQLKPQEFLNQNFAAKNRKLGLAPNVAEITNVANELSAFVSDSILCVDVPIKTRKTLLKQWIKIADKCYELKNFTALLSIMSSLQSVNILRLKKVWEMLSSRYHNIFQSLKQFLLPDKNFSNYRNMLKCQSAPCIPHLGIYLTDLTFIDEGNSKFRLLGETKLINFDRYQRMTKLIGEIQKFQVPYKLAPSKELQVWLRGEMKKSHRTVSKDHNAMWRRSCIVEPKASKNGP